jgi:D-alanyl-D-alanine carboxypeptidase
LTAFGRFVASLLTLLGFLAASGADAGPSLVFDPRTAEVISQERAGEPWYPASLTKLMTGYLVFKQLRSGALRLDQKISVSETAAHQQPSKLGIRAGNTVSVDLALQAMLVYSANDMAVVLAEASAGSVAAFADRMNETARSLGMTGSHFVNPNGLFDPRQVVTARDLGILVSAIVQDFPEHAHYFSQPNVVVGKRRLRNRNSLLRQMPDADGMKTGFVCNSGFNLVASATRDGRKLAAVVLGAASAKARADLAQLLLESSFTRNDLFNRSKIAQVRNTQLGTLVPADLTGSVCKGKNGINIADAKQLSGWGITLGNYQTAQLADMALRGRLPGARDLMRGGSSGVVRMPASAGYGAVVWDMEQQASASLCGYFKQQNVYCDVMTPDSFLRIATLSPSKAEPIATGDAQQKPAGKRKKKFKTRER